MATPLAPDAIVFVPGMFRFSTDQGAEVMGHRLAAAINYKAVTTTASFTAQIGQAESYAPDRECEVVTIMRTDEPSESPRPVADVYTFEYRDILIDAPTQQKPLLQALSMAWLLLGNSDRLVGAFRRRGKTWHEKLHVLYAAIGFGLIAVYMLVLMFAAVAAIYDVIPKSKTMPTIPKGLGSSVEIFVLIVTSAGLFSKANAKDALNRIATEATAVTRYLSNRDMSGVTSGQLADLVDHIVTKAAQAEHKYDRIHIIAYSVGTLICVDALFPAGPIGEPFRHVTSIATIGCPFDFIRTYWPRYFSNRHIAAQKSIRWVNFYSRPDIFASDFVDNDGSQQGIVARWGLVTPESLPFGPLPTLPELSFMERLQFAGFAAHTRYWKRGVTHELNVFADAIGVLLADTPALL